MKLHRSGLRVLAALVLALCGVFALPGTAEAAVGPCRTGSPAVLFVPGGQSVLAYTPLETRLWSLEGRELFRLSGEVWRAISPNGRTIATQRSDNTVRLWGLDGRQTAVLSGHRTPISHVAFSADGRRIVTASPGDVVRLWDAQGAPIAAVRAEEGDVESPLAVSWSPDGQRLLIAGPGPVRIWTRDGRLLAEAAVDVGRVSGAAFSPDGQRLIVAGAQGSALADLDGRALQTLNQADEPVTKVAFSPDGQHLATLLGDNTTQIWDASGKQVGTALGPSLFSPNGQQLLSIGEDGSARLRDLTGRAMAALIVKGSSVTDATFSPDSSRIITVGTNGPLRLWDEAGQPLAQFQQSSSWGCVLARAAFSPDGTRAATIGVYRVVQLWDLEQMQSIDLHIPTRTWYWLTVINPTLLLSIGGMWLTTVKFRAPEKRRLQNQRTLLAMWPAWTAAYGLALLVGLVPLWPVQLLAGVLLANMLWHISHGYLPQVSQREWLAACTLGWISGWVAGELLRLALFPHGIYVDTRLVVLPLAGLGMAIGQWLILRGTLRGAHLLAICGTAGWLGGPLVTGAEFTHGWLELALIQGLSAGALAGAGLLWLLFAPEDSDETA
jgi:WD40 repeat protein